MQERRQTVGDALALKLPPDGRAPGRARAEVGAFAEPLLPEDRVADARLLVTELVTNGVLHGGGEVRVLAGVSDGTLHVEVVDEGAGFGTSPADPHREGGWGLGIVEHLADRWGVFDGSTHVWFQIDGVSG